MTTRILLILTPLLFLSCRTEEDTPIDPFHLPPFIAKIVVSPLSFNTDTINVGPERLPTDQLTLRVTATAQISDPEGLSDIEEVIARIRKPESQTVIRSTSLLDDGKPPDLLAGDGLFSALLSFTIVRSDIGDFKVDVLAHDKGNLTSNVLSESVTILRMNRPPVLSEPKAPDTLITGPSPLLFKVTVRATDPDGQSDINRVFFNSFRPDNTPSTGNPFQMFDDGNVNGPSGDSVAGDGVYSLVVQLPANATRGTYRFEFQATDRSQALSNLIIHQIIVR